jgi:D-arabinitol dehydrogenase (NADP+)
MKAIVYTKPQCYSIQDVPEPKAGQRQIVVHVKRCGICKTDLHIHHGRFISQFPLTPGHEFCGEVVEVGSDVTEWKSGDLVTCDNTVLCGYCYYCRRNQPLYCQNFYSLGCTGPGGLAEYVLVNADKAFRIPDNLTLDEAAFTEPLSCVVHGVDMLNPKCGDKILIFGAGPAAILLSQLVQQCGAAIVVVVAPTQFKLDTLNRLGVKHTVLMHRNDFTNHVEAVRALAPEGYDIVIDATGSPRVIEHTFLFTKMGSKVLIYGVCNEEDLIQVKPYWLFRNEIKLIGSFAQTHCFDRAVSYLEQGVVRVDDIITHRFGLAEYAKALTVLADGKENLKIMVHPTE